MSELQRGTPERVEPGLHPDGGAAQMAARAAPIGERNAHPNGLPGETTSPDPAPASAVPDPNSTTPILNAIEAEIARLSAVMTPGVASGAPTHRDDLGPFTPAAGVHAPGDLSEPPSQPGPQPVPQFAPGPDVPRFSTPPDVPRFAQGMPDGQARAQDEAAFGAGGAHAGFAGAATPGANGASPDADLPHMGGSGEAPGFSQRWGRRLALGMLALLTLGAVIGALVWYNGQRKVDRSLEVLARSTRAPGQAAASVMPPAVAASAGPAAAPIAAPSIAAAPAPAATQVAPGPQANVTPAPMPANAEPVPPLVLLPSDQRNAATPPGTAAPGPSSTAAAAGARPDNATHVGAGAPAKTGKAAAKVNAKKKKTRAGAAKPGAKKSAKGPKRRCKRGELARVCLGLRE